MSTKKITELKIYSAQITQSFCYASPVYTNLKKRYEPTKANSFGIADLKTRSQFSSKHSRGLEEQEKRVKDFQTAASLMT